MASGRKPEGVNKVQGSKGDHGGSRNGSGKKEQGRKSSGHKKSGT